MDRILAWVCYGALILIPAGIGAWRVRRHVLKVRRRRRNRRLIERMVGDNRRFAQEQRRRRQ